MRKRTVNHLADTIFWYLLYFLPVLAYLLFMLIEPGSVGTLVLQNFEDFVNALGFGFVADNLIIDTLSSIFGVGGIMPIFSTNAPFIIFTWFIGVYLLHLIVDFILFIPRIAHKWLKHFTQGE